MDPWEQIVLGIAALVILIWFWPGAAKRARESPEGSKEDWIGLLLPLGAVVGFVILLVVIVSN